MTYAVENPIKSMLNMADGGCRIGGIRLKLEYNWVNYSIMTTLLADHYSSNIIADLTLCGRGNNKKRATQTVEPKVIYDFGKFQIQTRSLTKFKGFILFWFGHCRLCKLHLLSDEFCRLNKYIWSSFSFRYILQYLGNFRCMN